MNNETITTGAVAIVDRPIGIKKDKRKYKEFTVSNETTTFLSWTLETGSEGSVEFTVADDVQLANLSLSNLMYDNATDMLLGNQ